MTGPARDPDEHGRLAPRTERRHRQPRGSEPLSARSPLRLRAGMSVIALVAATIATILFLLDVRGDGGTGSGVAAAVCAVLALIALIDLLVIARRFRA